MNFSAQCWPILSAVAVVFAIFIPVDDANAQRNRRGARGGTGWDFVAGKYDTNKDGTVSAEEYTRGAEGLTSLDSNGDGVLTKEDWATRSRAGRGSGAVPKVGEKAPDFSLTLIKNQSETVTLSNFADKKPVALIFGSCT
ncbi:hypothetical protein [Mariniblastus fucicola]|uniref:EF hand n=1 Tax=Mariniblastus fucicola TaxID=980251 RepID=A0A5B9PCW4_9BACT|nr:hypothetical protein [Mariniblastus fucicola]QEG24597.1 EF hand [Mariniblastus fucicola]